MAAPTNIPTNLPQRPTNIPTNNGGNNNNDNNNGSRSGLSLGATIGIGLGVALFVILGAIGTWIFVRRRRRKWGQNRRKQGDTETKGETPEEEIVKKVEEHKETGALAKEIRIDGAVEVDAEESRRFELGVEVDKTGTMEKQPLSELYGDINAHGPKGASEPVEIDDGKVYIAELEGSNVPEKETEIGRNT